MELKNVNPNGGNIIASNLTNLNNFSFYVLIVKIELK
jgi:hypothetical protein